MSMTFSPDKTESVVKALMIKITGSQEMSSPKNAARVGVARALAAHVIGTPNVATLIGAAVAADTASGEDLPF